MGSVRVAIDIGGTFTDVCALDEVSGKMQVAKTPTTPDPIDGFMTGLTAVGVNLSDIALLSHGTTVATNALITRRLPRVAMICTRGFRDVIEIRRANKEDLWDAYKDVARPYIPRRDRLAVSERIDAAGVVVTKLDQAEALELARILRRRQVAAVAVCFMNAFMNGENERAMRDILLSELPGVPVSISSEVLPEIFEHERFSTTVVNAVLSPVAGAYVERLSERLRAGGYASDLLLLHSGGGVMTPSSVRDFAGRIAGSGIAAGAIASRHIAGLCGFANSIGLDMGGTSCDVSLAYEGQSRVTKDWGIEFGYPIRFPSIEVLTIGAGGGSLARIEDGALKNGPQSAGAHPGPACYGGGNTVPTNTDANIVLGRLGTGLAGGSIKLDAKLAEQAVRVGVAEQLGVSVPQAADAIIRVANANMADAVRLISISRGYDPRDFALVAFGGAGALHGAALARELSIPVVIIPTNPGITSALGCLLVDLQHDFAESYLRPAEATDPADLQRRFATLEATAAERLLHEGVAMADMVMQRSVDMMYQGQWRSLSVPVPPQITTMEALVTSFHEQHEREYNFRRDDAPVSLFRLNLKATGVVPKAALATSEPGGAMPQPASRRSVYFDNATPHDTPVYWRSELPAGAVIEGPAIIDQLDATSVLPPGASMTVDRFGNLVMRVGS
ncbi:hydantoinase/oxoprolinase family protein [Rhodopila sp.]|uniref:hydantoinase/oxoprolinase family protein n=1 Tax=Rhodopila sp. TaxID=2480087 RepID=UPI003D11141B